MYGHWFVICLSFSLFSSPFLQVDGQVVALLVQNLERLDESVREEADGVHNTLGESGCLRWGMLFASLPNKPVNNQVAFVFPPLCSKTAFSEVKVHVFILCNYSFGLAYRQQKLKSTK